MKFTQINVYYIFIYSNPEHDLWVSENAPWHTPYHGYFNQLAFQHGYHAEPTHNDASGYGIGHQMLGYPLAIVDMARTLLRSNGQW